MNRIFLAALLCLTASVCLAQNACEPVTACDPITACDPAVMESPMIYSIPPAVHAVPVHVLVIPERPVRTRTREIIREHAFRVRPLPPVSACGPVLQ